MDALQRFGRFWFDFVVGDDPVLAIGAVASIGAAIGLHALGVNGWWGICLGTVVTLVAALYRATVKG
jgi:hypothetical protein